MLTSHRKNICKKVKKTLDKYFPKCYNKDTKREEQTSKKKEIITVKKIYKVTMMMNDGYTFDIFVDAFSKREAKTLAQAEGLTVVNITC